MKNVILGLSLLAFVANVSLANDKDKNKKCEKTEVGCCKKGEKASKCCADTEKEAKLDKSAVKKSIKKAA
ncbi:MAG: hypothetical protein V4585_08060 [Bacteroidota bacterium]|jgi:hypothetical protein